MTDPEVPRRRLEDQDLESPVARQLSEKLQTLRELLEVSRYLNGSLEMRTVLERIVEASTTVLKAEGASILLLDRESGQLVFEVVKNSIGGGAKLESLRLEPGEGIAGQCVVCKQVKAVPDVRSDPDHSGRFDVLTGIQTRSLIAAPLLYHDEVYGVLEVINPPGGTHYFRQEEIERVEALASMAAQSVVNARLLAEVKAQQAELVHKGKLAAIGTIAAGVAHELNQPLTGIRAFTQMMARSLQSGEAPSEVLIQKLEFIDKQVGRMTRIIDHLRTFARASRLEFRWTQLNNVVQDAFMLMDQQLRNASIEIVLDLQDELPTVWGDPVRLEEVVINLVANARDALDGAHRKVLTVRTRDSDGLVRIEVRDTGSGIPSEILGRIFDPFFTTKAAGQGTGLGLSITHGIVREHNGRISVESQVGQGTAFIIQLPCKGGQGKSRT